MGTAVIPLACLHLWTHLAQQDFASTPLPPLSSKHPTLVVNIFTTTLLTHDADSLPLNHQRLPPVPSPFDKHSTLVVNIFTTPLLAWDPNALHLSLDTSAHHQQAPPLAERLNAGLRSPYILKTSLLGTATSPSQCLSSGHRPSNSRAPWSLCLGLDLCI